MPTELASGEQEDIAQGRIEWMSVKDALKNLPMVAIQDDILRSSDLVTITRQNNCYLPERNIRGLIAASVTPSIKVKGNLTLLLSRHGTHQLISLPIKVNSRVVVKKHVLEDLQCGASQLGVPCIAKMGIESLLRVKNVELGVDRLLAIRWQKRSSSVNKLSLDPERVGSRLSILIEGVHLATHRSHCKGIVVVVNVLAE